MRLSRGTGHEQIFAHRFVGAALAISAGCSNRHAQEVDARLESAENNAATARLRADEAYMKADQAMALAEQAQRTAPVG
ncbi:Lpp/OprI family alanine-zipper lipoprotein [Pseudomonas sp. AF76]|uniref:Lpp/OprI family alanine-zipper lipoprotein n=1 Tax=Pseudomonas sp. AF76 TaxID=554393 RepID=UPI00355877E1